MNLLIEIDVIVLIKMIEIDFKQMLPFIFIKYFGRCVSHLLKGPEY